MDYKLEKIVNNLKKEKAETETRIDAWKKVKIVTKKDGKPYQNMNRNFEGATYRVINYSPRYGENELYVYGNKDGVYANDTIRCYELVKGLKDENKKAKMENYIAKSGCWEQIYEYDLEDIKQAIKERIKYLENYAVRLEKDIENVEKLYTDFEKDFNKIKENLIEQCETSVYSDIMQEIVRYF